MTGALPHAWTCPSLVPLERLLDEHRVALQSCCPGSLLMGFVPISLPRPPCHFPVLCVPPVCELCRVLCVVKRVY